MLCNYNTDKGFPPFCHLFYATMGYNVPPTSLSLYHLSRRNCKPMIMPKKLNKPLASEISDRNKRSGFHRAKKPNIPFAPPVNKFITWGAAQKHHLGEASTPMATMPI
jgi:hypothetical protein